MAWDACGGIHGLVGLVLGNGDGVGIGHTSGSGADVATSLYDFVEGGAVHHQVADDGEGFGTPRLNPNLVAVVELAHVKLAGGDAIVVAVGTTIDIEAAHAADAFATVVVETDGVGDAVVGEFLVELVEHLEERAVGADVVDFVGLEVSLGTGVLLPPDM